MTSEQVMDAFKEKGIEVTIYQSPFKTIERVVVDTHNHDKQIKTDALGEYATILMSVFSHSCEFYRTVDGSNIEAIEKQYIDDVVLKCLEKVKGGAEIND